MILQMPWLPRGVYIDNSVAWKVYLLGNPVVAARPTDDAPGSHLPDALSRQSFNPEQLVAVANGLDVGAPVGSDTWARDYIAAKSGPLAAERLPTAGGAKLYPGSAKLTWGSCMRIAGDSAVASLAPVVRRLLLGGKNPGLRGKNP